MLFELDKAIKAKFGSFAIDDVDVECVPKEKFREIAEKAVFPMVTFDRYDRKFDKSRYSPDLIAVPYCSTNPDETDESKFDKVKLYAPPQPFNVYYQVELIAKEMYQIDMLEMLVEKACSPFGDAIHFTSIGDGGSEENLSFGIRLSNYKPMDEVIGNEKIYRRIYSYEVKVAIDYNKLVGEEYIAKSVENEFSML